MTLSEQKESNMGTTQGGTPKGTQYERAFCDICHGEIPLTKDGKLRLHKQRDHHLYGVPGALVPYCPASRSRLHSGVRTDQ
jgi:hypothetical protein